MSAAREPCPNCQLPYYTDRNTACPYCGMGPATGGTDTHAATDTVETTPAGSVARTRPPERPRATCSNCGLPHYADTGSGCPYCDAADRTGATSEAAPADPVEPADPVSEPASASAGAEAGDAAEGTSRATGQRSGGLLASLKRLVGR